MFVRVMFFFIGKWIFGRIKFETHLIQFVRFFGDDIFQLSRRKCGDIARFMPLGKGFI